MAIVGNVGMIRLCQTLVTVCLVASPFAAAFANGSVVPLSRLFEDGSYVGAVDSATAASTSGCQNQTTRGPQVLVHVSS